MFKSLAKQAPYLAAVGVAINAKMKAWNGSILPQESVHIVAWDGDAFITVGGIYRFKDACFPAEVDEKIRVTDADYFGIKERIDIENKRASDESSFVRGGVKRAEKQMREMTAKEIYELAHQGAAFARFYDGHFKQLDFVKNAAYRPEWHRYCLLSEMTDDKPSTWAWRELKTECDA